MRHGVFLYACLLVTFGGTACTSSRELVSSEEFGSGVIRKREILQGMPMPITHRYPMVQIEYGDAADANQGELAGNSISARVPEIEYFNCTQQEESTLLDGIANVDVSFIEADIRDALLELSLLTDISIITDDSIEGIVSVNFVDKSLDEVIVAIIAPGNYGYKKFDSFIYVGSQSPTAPSFHLLAETCTYKPVYIQPAQIVELLTPYYQQYVNYYEGHDHISIVAPDTIQRRIQSDVRIFDQVPQQILLEMSIVEVSAEALEMLGVKWRREISTADLLIEEGAVRGNILGFYQPNISKSPVAQALIESLSALNTGEEVQVRAMPSIVTLNGRQANFSSTQTVWLPMLSISNNNTINEVNYGVDLRIVPFISKLNHIRLEILKASVSDLTTDFNGMPKLISHTISTSVIMLDGETLVLGGLMQKKSRNQRSKVPGFSKTPFIGGLFRHTEQAMVTTEVLILIRPKILGI